MPWGLVGAPYPIHDIRNALFTNHCTNVLGSCRGPLDGHPLADSENDTTKCITPSAMREVVASWVGVPLTPFAVREEVASWVGVPPTAFAM